MAVLRVKTNPQRGLLDAYTLYASPTPASASTERTPFPFLPTGVRLISSGGATTEFRGCTFVGNALAMIHASGLHLVVTGCRFENLAVPLKLTEGMTQPNELHPAEPEGGVDIYMGGLPAERVVTTPRPTAASIATNFLRILGLDPAAELVAAVARQSAANPNVSERLGVLTELGTLTAQDCRSTSLQFLVTTAFSVTPGGGNSTIIGLHHRFPVGLTLRPRPAAIVWRAASVSGATLVLCGCRFDDIHGDDARIYAPGGSAAQPSVMDMGILTGDQDIVPVSPDIETPGVISGGAIGSTIGYVPRRVP